VGCALRGQLRFSLSVDRIFVYNMANFGAKGPNFLLGVWSFNVNSGHRSLVQEASLDMPIVALTPNCFLVPESIDSNAHMVEFRNGQFRTTGRSLVAAATIRRFSHGHIICEENVESRITVTNFRHPERLEQLASFFARYVQTCYAAVIDPQSLNLIILRYHELCSWAFCTIEEKVIENVPQFASFARAVSFAH
jgi:hypothetical protein